MAALKKLLVFVHRWLGVSLCLIFLLWFLSGFVLMYCEYPMVAAADRLARAPALNAAAILISPAQAYAALHAASPVAAARLAMLDNRPVYRFRLADFDDPGDSVVYADTGRPVDDYSADLTARIAAAWVGRPAAAAVVQQLTEPDQWTVSGEFDGLRPLRKYTWPDGEQVYVSSVTGDVVQYTTRASRLGAWFGAIPHWLYFTPLRRHAQAWSRAVIWLSGAGALAALLGIVIGVTTYSPGKRFRRHGAPAGWPYSGSKRWHAILGLAFGIFALGWVSSGMLSMDPFPRLQGEIPSGMGGRISAALRGRTLDLAGFSDVTPAQALAEAGDDFAAKEIELVSFAGAPFYRARNASGESRILQARGYAGAPSEFDRAKIIDAIRQAAQPFGLAEVRLVGEYEAYYVDRRGRLPLPVIFVRLGDPQGSLYYVDPTSAEIVASYENGASRWNRWLYHGLHSMDLPWLYRHRPLWDVWVIALLAGGASLCVTSVLLAWRVLRSRLP